MAQDKVVARRASKKTKEATVSRKLTRPDPAAYNEVVAKARILDIRLIRSGLEITPTALDGDQSDLSLKISDDLLDWSFAEEEERLWGEIAFSAACHEGDVQTMIATGDYLVGYGVDGSGVDAEAAKEFLARVGRFACYPYFRTLFATLTGQAGLVFPPLPVLKEGPRFISSPQKKKREAKTNR